MKLRRANRSGPSGLWAFAFRAGMAKPTMAFWRVVCECRPLRRLRHWPDSADAAVTAVFVWARTSEEAEGLASLALEDEGLVITTADAKKAPPAARPRKAAMAVARTEFVFLPRIRGDAPMEQPRRGARA